MKEIEITKEMLEKAEARVNKITFNESKGLSKFGSEKDRTLFGYLGEEMAASYLNITLPPEENFDYDFLYRDKKMETKTISCKFQPPPHYLCTVNSYDLRGVHKQKADYYIFTRILYEKTKGWILGYISCEEFFKKGTFIKRGESFFYGQPAFKANATVLKISELAPIENINTL